MASPIKQLQERWVTLRPEQKRRYKLSAFIAGAAIFAVLSRSLFSNNANKQQELLAQAEKTSNTDLLPQPGQTLSLKQQGREIYEQRKRIAQINQDLASLQKVNAASVARLQQRIKTLNSALAARTQSPTTGLTGAEQDKITQLAAEIAKLKKEEQDQKYMAPASTGPAPSSGDAAPIRVFGAGNSGASNMDNDSGNLPPPPSATSGLSPGVVAPPPPPPTVMTVNAKTGTVQTTAPKLRGVFLPAGSILTGVLLNGLDVSTIDAASKNQVTDIRLRTNALLPNRFRMDLIDCNMLASGYGDQSSSRAMLRTNLLSCVTPKGGVINVPAEGYIVGSDGLVGVKGILVSHQNSLILKSLLAGIASGFGNSAQQTQVPVLGLSPQNGSTQSYQSPNFSALGQNAVLNGAGQGANNISQFYLKEAEALAPDIQVNPGVSVSIILVKGLHLDIAGKTTGKFVDASTTSGAR
jgi:conjugal transfer pilus assembly protein TraB